MSKEKKLIPALRFPEFEGDGEWEEKPLQYVADSESSSLALNKLELKDKGYPVYGADSIVGYIDEFQQEEKYISIVKDGSGVGRLNLCEAKSSILGTLACIKSKDLKKFNLNWIYYQLNTIDFTSYKKGSGIPHIYFSDFKVEPIGVPKPQEQQKIASCLSSLDELLFAHNDKLNALKDHKKGLLQNLFPTKSITNYESSITGEDDQFVIRNSQTRNLPKVRFPEFEGDGEWVEKKLGEMSHKIMVGIASAATQAYRKSGIILFRNQNIKEGYLDDRDILFIDEEYEKTHKNKRLKAGDLLTARTGYPGTTCVVPKKYEGSQSFTTLITRPDNSIVHSDFLCLFINSEKGQSFFEATKIGGGQKNVNAGSLTEMPILFPSKKEQQKIASCLSAVDELITAQQEKIEQLQQHRKGLMQGLFPIMN